MKNHRWYHELSLEEREAIHDKRDCPIISVIDDVPSDIKSIIDKELYYIACNPGYISGEIPWYNDFKWYDCKNEEEHNKRASFEEVFRDYRLYFAAKNPNLVNKKVMSEELTNFLSEVYKRTKRKFGFNLPLPSKLLSSLKRLFFTPKN